MKQVEKYILEASVSFSPLCPGLSRSCLKHHPSVPYFLRLQVALHLYEMHVETRPVFPSLDDLSVQLISAY